MSNKDFLDLTVTGASARALDNYHDALTGFHCYIGDPVGLLDEALEDSPNFVMAHVMKGYLNLAGTDPGGRPVAQAAYEAAKGLPATGRERGHVAALGKMAGGQWREGARILEDVAIEAPRDILALQTGHLVDFLLGESRMLRDRIARALPAWSEGMPGYHALLGMHAFGLEETGDYVRAEQAGRKAVQLEPRDGWAYHAVAHVMEMQSRAKDGIAWMRSKPEDWSRDSFFAVHNWWHVALFHLELGEVDEVLRLFDGPIYGKHSEVAFDLVDASALLWRLYLKGVVLGNRWTVVADAWEKIIEDNTYSFNDAHAMMAFVGAGRTRGIERVLSNIDRALKSEGDNRDFTVSVGSAVTQAILAFGEGDYDQAVSLLRPVRNGAARFGGSHAQRDLIDLTLIEAAIRDGQTALARALAQERSSAKPGGQSGPLFLQRLNHAAQASAA